MLKCSANCSAQQAYGCLAALLTARANAGQTGAGSDPGSLDRLHDIIEPAAVNLWWPLAPGWYLLAAAILGVAAWGIWRARCRQLRRRYRVEALAELQAIDRAAGPPAEVAAAILVLLKRTALAAYPRARIAGLNGAPWWAFLDRGVGSPLFAGGLGDSAAQLAYTRRGAAGSDNSEVCHRLSRAAATWIRSHSVGPLPDTARETH